MGGLGNSRRGGRSPPLMIAALIACILVLGFNYWVSSSRNLEFQTKLYELEGQVKRGAAAQGVAELKRSEFQEQIQEQKEQIQRQKEQVRSIEELYKKQLEEAQSNCGKDTGAMQLNISSSTKTIQLLKGESQLSQLSGQMQSCQANLNTLNLKFTYEMTQCNTQMVSQKEVCDERVAAAKSEGEKRLQRLKPATPASSQQAREGAAPTIRADQSRSGLDETKTLPVLNRHPVPADAKEPSELLTNEISLNKGPAAPVVPAPDQGLPIPETESKPRGAAAPLNTLRPLEGAVAPQPDGPAPLKLQQSNNTEANGVELMDVREDEVEEADPGVEGMLIDQDKREGLGQKVAEPGEYDIEEQMPGGVDLDPAQSRRAGNTDKDMEEEVADYNGDEDNEGEFEADKQAELAQD